MSNFNSAVINLERRNLRAHKIQLLAQGHTAGKRAVGDTGWDSRVVMQSVLLVNTKVAPINRAGRPSPKQPMFVIGYVFTMEHYPQDGRILFLL